MYRPADDYSSDEDYDGFCFGGPGHDSPVPKPRSYWVADPEKDMYDAVYGGNLEELVKQVESIQFDINQPVQGGLTLLHHACKFGHPKIVEYLLENGAKPNRQVDSITPLMEACCCLKDPQAARDVVKLLLDRDAVINVSDKYGMTPFMFACKSGFADVVKMLIKKASLDASDNQGWTALFHAIESNHPEVVQLLIAAGVDIEVPNRKGYTPRQVAQFHGFCDILDLFPPEVYTYLVPTTYLSYSTIRDRIPRIFLKSETPEYFPEISTILRNMNMERFLEVFARNKVDLGQFLIATDQDLKAFGIEYPFHRGKILLGLLNYHLSHWSKSSISRVTRRDSETFYDILMLSANHLQNLITVNASLKYIVQNLQRGICGSIRKESVKVVKQCVREYKGTISQLKRTTKYLSQFSPERPPLLIDFQEYKAIQRKKNCMKNCVKYSIFIGLSIVICLKIKRLI